MNTLVTGGAGFIGSHVVEALLEKGHRVTVLDNFSTGRPENLFHLKENPNLKVIKADISIADQIKPYFNNIDWVFHLAALADIVPSINFPLKYFNSNVLGTVNVLESSRLAGVKRLVYTASSSCYGIPDSFPTLETADIRNQYPYAFTKYTGEQAAFHWAKVYNLGVVSLRLFNVYGLRSRTNGTYGAVFGVFLSQKLAKKPFTVVGDGNQTRDFVYVSDVAKAFILAADSNVKNQAFNVGTGKPQSINNLVKHLEGPVVHIPKRPGEPNCTQADITKIKETLNWNPLVPFEEGVKLLLKNISYWQDAPVWTPENIAEATKEWFQYLTNKN